MSAAPPGAALFWSTCVYRVSRAPRERGASASAHTTSVVEKRVAFEIFKKNLGKATPSPRVAHNLDRLPAFRSPCLLAFCTCSYRDQALPTGAGVTLWFRGVREAASRPVHAPLGVHALSTRPSFSRPPRVVAFFFVLFCPEDSRNSNRKEKFNTKLLGIPLS